MDVCAKHAGLRSSFKPHWLLPTGDFAPCEIKFNKYDLTRRWGSCLSHSGHDWRQPRKHDFKC